MKLERNSKKRIINKVRKQKDFSIFLKQFKEIIYWEEFKSMHPASRLKAVQHSSMANSLEKNCIFDSVSKSKLTDLAFWRLHTIDFFQSLIGKSISGKVMEIGSGKAVASAYISSFKDVQEVTALDYSYTSLADLLPVSHYQFKGSNPTKLKRVYGSFFNIKESNYDYIFGFGAIHNSPDLESIFKELYRVIKDGGYFVSSDMCEYFHTSVKDEENLTNRPIPNSEKRYGKKLIYSDTNDFFRSPYDYLFYAKKAGFRVYPIIFDVKGSKKKIKRLDEIFSKGGINTFYPSNARGRVDKLLLVCYKDNFSNKLLTEIKPANISIESSKDKLMKFLSKSKQKVKSILLFLKTSHLK